MARTAELAHATERGAASARVRTRTPTLRPSLPPRKRTLTGAHASRALSNHRASRAVALTHAALRDPALLADLARPRRIHRSVRRRQLERTALAHASELRKIGESYLRAGNLREARQHLQQADALLQMDAAKYARNRQALCASSEYRLTGLPKGDSYL